MRNTSNEVSGSRRDNKRIAIASKLHMISTSTMKNIGKDAFLREAFPRSLADKLKRRRGRDNRDCEALLLEQAKQVCGFICSNAR